MEQKKMLPVGVENFEKLLTGNFYYVDKTGLIRDFLYHWSKVTLFNRPHRFGKSLNMSMLYHFFSIEGDKSIFEGLEISRETELCGKYMGKYPVIFLTFKGIEAEDYERAYQMTSQLIARTANQFNFLLESEKLNEYDKASYEELLDDNMSEVTFHSSLHLLCELLEKHFGQQTILIIDDYDVPLAKAYEYGYYSQMNFLIIGLFSEALKSNYSLEFGILNGCLQVSNESIITGLNNVHDISVTDVLFSEYFGFTDAEVQEMLAYYGISECYEKLRLWYNGYRFGNTDIYCPKDVINYCDSLKGDPNAIPKNYWTNSSGNDAVREFVSRIKTATVRAELQTLAEGGTVRKRIRQELSYPEMYRSLENMWSLLFMTGYLTCRTKPTGAFYNLYDLSIPNREIQSIFQDEVMHLFFEQAREDGESLQILCQTIQAGDAKGLEESFSDYLQRVISIRDTGIRDGEKENIYYGILLGLLEFKTDWDVKGNCEIGYGDITLLTRDKSLGVILEVKYAHDGNLDAGIKQALKQIEEKNYTDELYKNGYRKILKYGIACYKKKCKVMLGR